ncbi:MAG: molybdopterin-dependent oxidoreductase [Dehalococcoidia bacterium]
MRTDASILTRKGSCPVCGSACHVIAQVEDGKVVKVRADSESPLGNLCIRGANAVEYHDHPRRLNHPLKRVGGRGQAKWERISWDQALDEIASKLRSIRKRYGPEAVLVLGGSPHGPGDPAAWKWCNLWGTPNFFHLGKNCGEGEYPVECAMYGHDTIAGWATFLDAKKTDLLVIWGGNPSESMPPLWEGYKVSQSQGMKIMVVDPRPTACAKQADYWLQLRPGTDGALALGMLHVMISEGLYDKAFVDKWCLGFDEVKALVQHYPPERMAEITWVPADKIVEAARVYATASAGIVAWGVANTHLGRGSGLSGVLGKCWLRALSGNLDREGGQVLSSPPATALREEIDWDSQINHPLRTRDNVSAGKCPIGSVKALSLYREAMKRVHPLGWGPAHYFIYPSPHAVWEAILTEKPYPIRAVFSQGTNTLCSMGSSRHAYDAFKSDNLELHVSMDHFLTPTGALADYVLPATDALERPNLDNMWGFIGSSAGREAAVDPLYERRDDYQLWADLGQRLGQAEQWPKSLEGWLDKILVPLGKTLKEFAASPGYFPPPEYKRYEKVGFATFSGKVELVPTLLQQLGYDMLAGYEEPPWSPVSAPEMAEEYPLILISGSRVQEFHHSSHRQLEKIRKRYPDPLLEIHPETAGKLGIAGGDWVWIETPMGKVKQRARLVEGMLPQIVHADGYWWFPEKSEAEPSLFGVWESNIDAIVPDEPGLSDYAGNSYFRGLLCKVYKAI